jgi:GAF domain-containing protein
VTAARPGLAGGGSLAGKARAAGGARRIAKEQAALRRVAVLVARGEASGEVLAAIAQEAGRVLRAQHAYIGRYDPDGTLLVVAAWNSDAPVAIPVGRRVSAGGRNLITLVLQTGRPARLDDYASATGEAGTFVRLSGISATVGAPVSVEGRLWGLVAVASTHGPLPAGTEKRLAAFTELAATAIANAQAREELRSFAAGQAALRRVAVLVSHGAPPEEVFAAVAEEVNQVLGTEYAWVSRYGPEATETVVGAWADTGDAVPIPVSSRLALGGRNVATLVFQTGRPARIDDYADYSGEVGKMSHEAGLRRRWYSPMFWRSVPRIGRERSESPRQPNFGVSIRVGCASGENDNPAVNNQPPRAQGAEVVFEPGPTSPRDVVEFLGQISRRNSPAAGPEREGPSLALPP